MNNTNFYLDTIEENIHNLVKVQKKINKHYQGLDKSNYDNELRVIYGLVLDEKDLLSGLKNNLNNLFGITPVGCIGGFKIRKGWLDYYNIKLPLFSLFYLDKSSMEFNLLSKLLTRLHDHYFLHDGMISYIGLGPDDYMWRIPNFAKDAKRKLGVSKI